MPGIKGIDFYYGAVLSSLLTSNSEHKPSLIEDGNEKRVFLVSTNKYQYMLRTHMVSGKRNVKENATSWTLVLSKEVVDILRKNHANGIRNVIALVLVEKGNLSKSKVIYFTDKHLMKHGTYDGVATSESFTVRKYENKRDYLLFTDKTEKNTIAVKTTLKLDY